MLRHRVHLDFHRHLCRFERLLQLRLGIGLRHVVVGGNPEIHPCLDLGRQQVRTGRRLRHEPAPMEGATGADPIRHRRGSADDERAAHAVALRADLLGLVHLWLAVEPRHERRRILLHCAGSGD